MKHSYRGLTLCDQDYVIYRKSSFGIRDVIERYGIRTCYRHFVSMWQAMADYTKKESCLPVFLVHWVLLRWV